MKKYKYNGPKVVVRKSKDVWGVLVLSNHIDTLLRVCDNKEEATIFATEYAGKWDIPYEIETKQVK
jgi:hypothetical protein